MPAELLYLEMPNVAFHVHISPMPLFRTLWKNVNSLNRFKSKFFNDHVLQSFEVFLFKALREISPNTDLSPVPIFLYSVRIQENADQK